MTKSRLDPKIYKVLVKKTKGKMKETSIRPTLSQIRQKHSFLTLNAAAEVFAKKHSFNVTGYLTDKDRETLANLEIKPVHTTTVNPRKKQKIEIIVSYDTTNSWLKSLINEINRSYTYGCYTACFVLSRKLLENMLIYNIIRKKYASKSLPDKELYFNTRLNRNHDFSVIIKNLRSCSSDFSPDQGIINRICQLSEGYKESANDMTHSLYHIAKKKEIQDKNIQGIIDLIVQIELNI